MSTTIRLCNRPESRRQTFSDACLRTPWQVSRLQEIANAPDFSYFMPCLGADQSAPDGVGIVFEGIKGPFNVTWVTADGMLRSERLGLDEVIQVATPVRSNEDANARILKQLCD